MWENFNMELVEILQRYASIIIGMHFGHDHADGFKIFPDMDGKVFSNHFLHANFFITLSL